MRAVCLSFFILCFNGVQGYQKVEVDSLHQQAYKLLDTNLDSAFALGALAESKAANAGLALERANSLFIQAYIFTEKEELGKAFVLYLKALEILRPLKGDEAIATYVKMLLNTGAILDMHYAYPQAIMYYDEAIRLAEEHKLKKQLLKFHHNKAEALRQLKKYDQALTTITSALELARSEKDEERILSLLNQQGLILKDMGQYEEARESYRQIIDFNFGKSSPEAIRGKAWHNTAVTYVDEKRYQEAAEAYQRALSEKALGDQKRLYITWLDLGEVYYLMGQYEKAYETEQKALSLYDDMLLQPDHYAIFSLLSKIAYALDKHDQAHTYSERFVAVNKRFLKAQKEILQVKDQYKMEILTAGFFQELEASETEKHYQLLLTLCVVFFTSIIAFEKIRQRYVRHSIKKAILKIENESLV